MKHDNKFDAYDEVEVCNIDPMADPLIKNRERERGFIDLVSTYTDEYGTAQYLYYVSFDDGDSALMPTFAFWIPERYLKRIRSREDVFNDIVEGASSWKEPVSVKTYKTPKLKNKEVTIENLMALRDYICAMAIEGDIETAQMTKELYDNQQERASQEVLNELRLRIRNASKHLD